MLQTESFACAALLTQFNRSRNRKLNCSLTYSVGHPPFQLMREEVIIAAARRVMWRI
jgi:hypothetical protein